jgi:hypothetical protein
MSEKDVETLLGPVDTLSEGLFYAHPGIIVDIEMKEGKVFQSPRHYGIEPLSCTGCSIVSATAIQSKRSEFILVTKLEENKKLRFDIKICADRRSKRILEV